MFFIRCHCFIWFIGVWLIFFFFFFSQLIINIFIWLIISYWFAARSKLTVSLIYIYIFFYLYTSGLLSWQHFYFKLLPILFMNLYWVHDLNFRVFAICWLKLFYMEYKFLIYESLLFSYLNHFILSISF